MNTTTTPRPIRTWYCNAKEEILATTASGSEARAVANAIYHAHTDDYGASYIIVYNCESGLDLAIIHRSPTQVNLIYRKASSVKRGRNGL